MDNASISMKVFAAYLFAIGEVLLMTPNFLLDLFGFSGTSEVWIRVIGVVVMNFSAFYWFAAKYEARPLYMVSVFTRTFSFIAFTAFALLSLARPMLVLFGAVDLAGALWTYLALKKSA